jgi:hypothetical protein
LCPRASPGDADANGASGYDERIRTSPGAVMSASLHEQDFLLWSEQQAELLRFGRLDALDVEGLLEEIEEMGREQKVALQSLIRMILVQLLKLALSPARAPRAKWTEEVMELRAQAESRIEDTPTPRAWHTMPMPSITRPGPKPGASHRAPSPPTASRSHSRSSVRTAWSRCSTRTFFPSPDQPREPDRGKEGKSKGMRQLEGVYPQSINRCHGLVGHLFQGRFKAILVERDAYLLALARCVVLNPVRARMVRAAEGRA